MGTMKKSEPGQTETMDSLAAVIRYHEATKHHFYRYARSLGYLDWANQPDPFRRYHGAPLIPLPILAPGEEPVSPLYEDLYRPGAVTTQILSLRSLSRFFEYVLAITAWKQAGDVRWALRSNPSSGNLHPTEGYLLIGAVAGVAPTPGFYHYAPKEHGLERRADWSEDGFARLMKPFPPHAFLMAFSSVHWREAWKYGERAFRYCQHDVGHAIGAARIAAAALGWRMMLLEGVGDDLLQELLGLDRDGDFEGAEREHPDCVAVVWTVGQDGGTLPRKEGALPLFLDEGVVRQETGGRWYGRANRLSPDEQVPWAIIDEAAAASWKAATDRRVVELAPSAEIASGRPEPVATVSSGDPLAGRIIRQRRSALAFDGKTGISAQRFFTMLDRVTPQDGRPIPLRSMPWDAIPWEPAVHLVLFVHLVEGLTPGLYVLVRNRKQKNLLRGAMHDQFVWVVPPACPPELPLFLLQEGDARRVAAQVSCGQDIAGESAFSLGMVAEFESSLRQHGAWFYRRLFWETGVIGQVLYLEAEAAGLRATGIGCFFDDPVHQVFGLSGTAFQSLYHFTVGGPVEDPRLTTLPPYGLDH
jgi:SagB-type dehydrogenase family enzyme